MNNIRIETSVRGGVIVNEITGPELDWLTNTRQVIACTMVDTRDAQVREALIRMGWTPPDKPGHRFKGLQADAIWMDEAGEAPKQPVAQKRSTA